jgi:LacI family transcriptional regulator
MRIVSPRSGDSPSAGSKDEADTDALSRTRVTQRDVARRAGVHNSTVSLALRDSPTLPLATREKIRALAASMGYAPDPAVQALVAYRRRLVRKGPTGTIAFVTGGGSRNHWQRDPADVACFAGVRARAHELGYKVDHFWVGEGGLTARRLAHVLTHRAITGMLLHTPTLDGLDWNDFDGTPFTVVAIGARPTFAPLHRVVGDPDGIARLALDRISASGRRRIGVILPAYRDEAHGGAWTTAFATAQQRFAPGDRVPLFVQNLVDPPRDDSAVSLPHALESAGFARWLQSHEPDVLLGCLDYVRPLAAAVGVRLPQDLAFVELDKLDAASPMPGIDQNHRSTGAIAVEILAHQMQQNRRGVPPVPTRTIVESVWQGSKALDMAFDDPAVPDAVSAR